jgi:hypothetical protein
VTTLTSPSRIFNRHHALIVAGMVTALDIAACRESEAPTGTSAVVSTVTLTLDTAGAFAEPQNAWGGVSLMLGSDQSVHIVALDPWAGRVRYHGCATACDDPAHWLSGTADSAPAYIDFVFWSSAVLTRAGIQAVNPLCPGDFCETIQYLQCAGACSQQQSWSVTDLFVAEGSLTSKGDGFGQSVSLAADSTGGLHLLFLARGALPSGLYYAYCGGSCGTQANWTALRLDSLASQLSPRVIAFDQHTGVHVLYASVAGLVHAACPAACTQAGSWRSAVADSGATVDALALAFGPAGQMDVAYRDDGLKTWYATCTTNCTARSGWAVTALPLRTRDVSLATSAVGAVFLATTDTSVAVSECTGTCLESTSWQTARLDSVVGGGHIALVVDATGRPRIASTGAVRPLTLQYTQPRQ